MKGDTSRIGYTSKPKFFDNIQNPLKFKPKTFDKFSWKPNTTSKMFGILKIEIVGPNTY